MRLAPHGQENCRQLWKITAIGMALVTTAEPAVSSLPPGQQGIEHLADLASKRVWGEGLLEEDRARVEHSVVHDGGGRVSRHVDDRHRRAKGREPVRQLPAAHFRHHHLVRPTVQFSTVAVLIEEGDQAGEEVAQLARIGFVR